MDYVFLWNFEREIGVRLAKIDPLRMLDVWPLCYSSFDGSIRTYYHRENEPALFFKTSSDDPS